MALTITTDSIIKQCTEAQNTARQIGQFTNEETIGDILRFMNRDSDHFVTTKEICDTIDIAYAYSGKNKQQSGIEEANTIKQTVRSNVGNQKLDLRDLQSSFSTLIGFDLEQVQYFANQLELGIDLDIESMTMDEFIDLLDQIKDKFEDFIKDPARKQFLEHVIDDYKNWGKKSNYQKFSSACGLYGEAVLLDPKYSLTNMPRIAAKITYDKITKPFENLPINPLAVFGLTGGATVGTLTFAVNGITLGCSLANKGIELADNVTGNNLQQMAYGINGVYAGGDRKIREIQQEENELKKRVNQKPCGQTIPKGTLEHLQKQVQEGNLPQEDYDKIMKVKVNHKGEEIIPQRYYDELSFDTKRAIDLAITGTNNNIRILHKGFYSDKNGNITQEGTFYFYFHGKVFKSWKELTDYRQQNGFYDTNPEKERKYKLVTTMPDNIAEVFNKISKQDPIVVREAYKERGESRIEIRDGIAYQITKVTKHGPTYLYETLEMDKKTEWFK